jgi:acyl-CoA reductase-like NAD-dependent aldehyde dehydrogenase
LVGETTQYGLTGALFARDRDSVVAGSNLLRNYAGNFYINDKCKYENVRVGQIVMNTEFNQFFT